jgi:hypothetical protein
MPKKTKHLKTAAAKVKLHFHGKSIEIRLVINPDMERRLYRRLRKRFEK